MTEVVILHPIPGHRDTGAIVAYEPWMSQHVRAGNVRILPAERESWSDAADEAPAVLERASTGVNVAHDDEDEPTIDENQHAFLDASEEE